MKIQIGEVFLNEERRAIVYQNKTYKYLVPLLSTLGVDFVMKYNNIFKLAIGIGDMLYTDEEGNRLEQHLFILIKTSIAPNHFLHFLTWVKDQDYYRDDYVFDNIQKTDMHMVVIKMPNLVQDSLSIWRSGEYSKMYPQDFLQRFFKDVPETQKVLIKDHDYRIQFVQKINDLYGTTITPKEYEGELDFKPKEVDEYFNDHLKPLT